VSLRVQHPNHVFAADGYLTFFASTCSIGWKTCCAAAMKGKVCAAVQQVTCLRSINRQWNMFNIRA
jgi:hypothetical protein